jgi:hypothetical protein
MSNAVWQMHGEDGTSLQFEADGDGAIVRLTVPVDLGDGPGRRSSTLRIAPAELELLCMALAEVES